MYPFLLNSVSKLVQKERRNPIITRREKTHISLTATEDTDTCHPAQDPVTGERNTSQSKQQFLWPTAKQKLLNTQSCEQTHSVSHHTLWKRLCPSILPFRQKSNQLCTWIFCTFSLLHSHTLKSFSVLILYVWPKYLCSFSSEFQDCVGSHDSASENCSSQGYCVESKHCLYIFSWTLQNNPGSKYGPINLHVRGQEYCLQEVIAQVRPAAHRVQQTGKEYRNS